MTKGRVVSRTEIDCTTTHPRVDCDTTVRAESIVTQPLTVTIQTVEKTSENHIIGKHSRVTDGKTYMSPRLLLPTKLNNIIGSHCRIFTAHGTVTSGFWNLQDKDILIVVLLPP